VSGDEDVRCGARAVTHSAEHMTGHTLTSSNRYRLPKKGPMKTK
jgi:hypothetical protein